MAGYRRVPASGVGICEIADSSRADPRFFRGVICECSGRELRHGLYVLDGVAAAIRLAERIASARAPAARSVSAAVPNGSPRGLPEKQTCEVKRDPSSMRKGGVG